MASTARTGLGEESAAAVYNRLKNDRQPYETRAENCAKVTIPSLFPKSSDNASTNYTTPWQAVGARGLNNLSAKVMLALFPLQSWMKLRISEWQAKQLVADPQQLAVVDQGLGMVERIMLAYMESNSYRVTLFELIRQLALAGNGCLYLPPPDSADSGYNPMKLYPLPSYVVQRDAFGNVLQIVTLDKVAYAALPEDVRNGMQTEGDPKPEEEVEVYTHVYLDEESGDYLSYQEVKGIEIEGTDGQYPREACPWIPVRWTKRDGEHYGRSHCEEYLGDLTSLEKLHEAMIKFSMIASKVVGLVNPNGTTQVRRLTKAQTGDFVAGRKADIEFLQLEKTADFTVAKSVADAIEARLAYVFMLNSAVQRQGERVTAEEIRYVASELEDTLGGVYSILSQELQLPIVRILLNQLQATSQIPDMPKEAVEPTVSTGLEALGRGQDLDKLTQFFNGLQAIAPLMQDPDLNMSNLKIRLANAIGIDTSGLLLTDADKAKRQAEQMVAQGGQQAAASLGAGLGAQATASPENLQGAMDATGVQMSPIGG
ncbi:portal protein [Pseudomonas asplenii]|uniref:portal protein n=1 Tax=Pseudomonas asplenii TaxID=53407 RepID=UPI0006B5BCA1|nr:portal protein [Pseudomonas fuscovaginae]KPA96908.1 Bacteriophage head to tail connecting protein [Pseudomonas fuscovaginae]